MNNIIYLKTSYLLSKVKNACSVRALRTVLASSNPHIVQHILHAVRIGYDHTGHQFIRVNYGSIASLNTGFCPISFASAKANILAYLETRSKIVLYVRE